MNKNEPATPLQPNSGAEGSYTTELLLAIHNVMLNIGAELRLPVLLSNILEQAQSLLAADRGGGVYFYEPESQALRLVYGSGINSGRDGILVQVGQGVAGKVYQTAQPQIVDNYTAWQGRATVLVSDPPSAVMGLPLILKGTVIGVLTLIANSHIRKFTDQDVQQAEMFAAQAAVAIQNARLYEQARQEINERQQMETALKESERSAHRLAQQLKLANQIGATITAGLDFERLMQTIYQQCQQIGDTHTFYVALYDEVDGMLRFPFFMKDGEQRSIAARNLQESAGVVGYVIQHTQVLYIPDTFNLSIPLQIIRQPGEPTRSVVGIPLKIHDRPVGVLSMQSHAPNAYTADQISLLEMLGGQIAIAIQNGQLYAQAQAIIAEREQMLAERKRAETALQASQVTLKAIIDSTSDLIWSVDAQSFGLLTFNTGLCDYFLKMRGIHLKLGLRPEDLFPTQDYIQTWRRFYQRTLAEGSYTVQYETYAGSILLELSFNLLTQDGRVFGVSVFGKDITESVRAQRALEELNRDLEQRVEERTAELRHRFEEIEGLHAELRDQSRRDPLTGLRNRRYLAERLPIEIARAQEEGGCLSVIVSDIDHFKRVNDTYGHQAGDQVLIEVAGLLHQHARSSDIICRYGGEEFLLVMSGATLDAASQRTQDLCLEIARLGIQYTGKILHIHMSFGVASYPIHGQDAEMLIIKADQALYHSKRTGRNRVTVWDETLHGLGSVEDEGDNPLYTYP